MILSYYIMICFIVLSPRVIALDEIDPYTIQDSIFLVSDIFKHDQPAELTLKFNIKEYQRNKHKDYYMPAELTYFFGDSLMERDYSVRVKARGTVRKKVCSFPPIMLNIKKSGIRDDLIPRVKKIKIVTHCRGSRKNLNYMMKEFLAYKIYGIISPYSFRVRLLKIKYIDTGRKDKVTDTWAFMIEPEAMLAGRVDMLPLKLDHLGFAHTDTLWTDYMVMFQYMIGNDDYSISGRHNIKLLVPKDPMKIKPIPVPYDFDYSGIVNVGYATPREDIGQSNITERYFLGPCRSYENFREIIEIFQSKKQEIYDLINNFEYLPESERAKMIKYLDEFYNNSSHSDYINKNILSTCQD